MTFLEPEVPARKNSGVAREPSDDAGSRWALLGCAGIAVVATGLAITFGWRTNALPRALDPVAAGSGILETRGAREPLTYAMERSLTKGRTHLAEEAPAGGRISFPEFLASLERLAPGNPGLAARAVQAKLRELGPNEAAKKTELLTALIRVGANADVASLARAEMSSAAAGEPIEDRAELTRYRIRANQLFLGASPSALEAVRGTVVAVRTLGEPDLASYYVGALLMKFPRGRDALVAEASLQSVNLTEELVAAEGLNAREVPAELRAGARLGRGARGAGGR